jgi:hypothetical protein
MEAFVTVTSLLVTSANSMDMPLPLKSGWHWKIATTTPWHDGMAPTSVNFDRLTKNDKQKSKMRQPHCLCTQNQIPRLPKNLHLAQHDPMLKGAMSPALDSKEPSPQL